MINKQVLFGTSKALVGHIQAGVRLMAFDPSALLVFSGGQTRAAAGPRDEGALGGGVELCWGGEGLGKILSQWDGRFQAA